MPREQPVNVPAGPGTKAPEYNAPSVAVATPGFAEQPQPTQWEKLKAAVLSVGGAVASGLQAEARIKNNLDRLRERALTEVDSALRTEQTSIQARRLSAVKKDMLALQVEGEDKGPAWMAQVSRTRLANAASEQEQELWGRMYIASSGAAQQAAKEAERDADMRTRQRYALAGHTAHNLAAQFEQEISLDPNLQQELIGNGTGIHKRVQDYLLSEIVASNPDSLIVASDDPQAMLKREQRDMLVAAVTGYGMNISDGLVKQFTKGRDQLSFQRGVHQVDADLFTFMTTDGDLGQLAASVGATFDENFTHMTEPEKFEAAKKRVLEAVQLAAQGQIPGRMADMLERSKSLLTLQAGGQSLFTIEEQAGLMGTMMEQARKTAGERLVGEIGAALRQQVIPLSDANGNYTFAADPNALSTLAEPGVNGLSTIDRLANKVLLDMGFLDKNRGELRPDENQIVGAIMMRANEMTAGAHSQGVAERRKANNYLAVINGYPGGDLNAAYDASPTTAAIEGRAVTVSQAATNKRLVTEIASAQGGVPESIRSWNGGPLPAAAPENRPLREAVLVAEARQWANPAFRRNYSFPPQLVDRIRTGITSGDAEAFHDALYFAKATGSEGNLEDLILSVSKNGSEVGTALHYAVAASSGLASNSKIKLDESMIQNQVKRIVEQGDLHDFLQQASNITLGTGFSNNRAIISSTIQAMRVAEPGDFDPADPAQVVNKFPLPEREVETILRQVGGNSMVTAVQRLGAAFMASHPGATEDTVGSFVYSYLNTLGLSMHKIGDRVIGVSDPNKHVPGHLKDIPAWASIVTQMPWDAEQRDLWQRAMDIDPKDTPVNMADAYQRAFPKEFETQTYASMQWDISPGLAVDGKEPLLRPATALGGFLVSAKLPKTGEPLPILKTKRDIYIPQPDGREPIFLPAGSPASTLSQYHQPTQFTRTGGLSPEEISYQHEMGTFPAVAGFRN